MCLLGEELRFRLCFLTGESSDVSSSDSSSIGFDVERREVDRTRGLPRRPSSTTLSLCLLLLRPLCGGVTSISSSDCPLFRRRPLSSPLVLAADSCVESCFCFCFRSSSPHRDTKTGVTGRSSLSTGTCAMRFSVSSPDTNRPNMVCFPFKCSHGSRVMKNWLPLVSLPKLAEATKPAASMFLQSRCSSANFSPS